MRKICFKICLYYECVIKYLDIREVNTYIGNVQKNMYETDAGKIFHLFSH